MSLFTEEDEMKKTIELLRQAYAEFMSVTPNTKPDEVFLDKGLGLLDKALAELKAPPCWYTPDQWEQLTGEPYPDEAPVWVVSKYAILEKPTKYNKLRWQLVVYKEAKDNMVVGIIFCAYNHLGPPPDDWRPEEANNG
jgi:hypothetical protein